MAAKQTATQKARGFCMIYSRDEGGRYSDNLISDFSDSLFQAVFKQYFSELGLHIRDWDGLFREMNADGGNLAFVMTSDSGNVIGFIQFKLLKFTCGFIREFWVADEYRNQAHGSALLALAEEHFLKNGIYTSILTTDTISGFLS
jgi:ribosomal protein S18 acetylase RimI-like enzyme|nr:GNAT family N-acetyltransferase [uncultured Acetatifactor sp.]